MVHHNHYESIVKKYQYNIVTQAGESMFTTIRDIEVILTNGDIIKIKKGYETDLASVPRFLWSIIPPFGEYTFAAIIHDYMYDNGLYSKSFADKEFLYIMRASRVMLLKRSLMYGSVIIFGRGSF